MMAEQGLQTEYVPIPEHAPISWPASEGVKVEQRFMSLGDRRAPDDSLEILVEADFDLLQDDFIQKWKLKESVAEFVSDLKQNGIKKTYDLTVPSKGVLDACRHRYNGISCRGFLCYRIQTDSLVLRFDVLFSA